MTKWQQKVSFQKYFYISFALSLLTALIALILKGFLPPLIPLFYGRPVGAEQLANYWFIFLIPLVSVVITFINLVVNSIAKDDFVKKIFAIGALVFSIMASITVLKIVFLVGFF